MHDHGKSDRPAVPAKVSNNAGRPAAEALEERGLAKGTRTGRHVPDAAPGQTCQAGWTVCER